MLFVHIATKSLNYSVRAKEKKLPAKLMLTSCGPWDASFNALVDEGRIEEYDTKPVAGIVDKLIQKLSGFERQRLSKSMN